MHENSASEVGHSVDIVVTGPHGQQIQSLQKQVHGDLTIHAAAVGEHAVCLTHNGTPTDKVVDLDVSLTRPEGTPGKPGELQAVSPTAEIEKTSARLKTDLTDLYHTLRYTKSREKRNFETVTSIKAFILKFSFFQSMVVVLSGLVQIYVLKTFFSNTGKARV